MTWSRIRYDQVVVTTVRALFMQLLFLLGRHIKTKLQPSVARTEIASTSFILRLQVRDFERWDASSACILNANKSEQQIINGKNTPAFNSISYIDVITKVTIMVYQNY